MSSVEFDLSDVHAEEHVGDAGLVDEIELFIGGYFLCSVDACDLSPQVRDLLNQCKEKSAKASIEESGNPYRNIQHEENKLASGLLTLDDYTPHDVGNSDSYGWTQLCEEHASAVRNDAHNDRANGLSPVSGAPMCGQCGCHKEAKYYWDFKRGQCLTIGGPWAGKSPVRL